MDKRDCCRSLTLVFIGRVVTGWNCTGVFGSGCFGDSGDSGTDAHWLEGAVNDSAW